MVLDLRRSSASNSSINAGLRDHEYQVLHHQGSRVRPSKEGHGLSVMGAVQARSTWLKSLLPCPLGFATDVVYFIHFFVPVCVHVCACMWWPVVQTSQVCGTLGITYPGFLFLLLLRCSLPLAWGFPSFSNLSVQRAPGMLLFLSSQLWDPKCTPPHLAFFFFFQCGFWKQLRFSCL